MRIAIVANTSWYLYNFRRNLMRALRADGHEVLAIGAPDDYARRLTAEAFAYAPAPFSGAGINPWRELQTVAALTALLRRWRADLALTYTPKGNIYAGLATRTLGIPFIPNVSGLGRVFINTSPLTALVRALYRAALGRAPVVFFQNNEDRETFVRARLVDAGRAFRIPGSGVDLDYFQPPIREEPGPFRFLMVARLLWDKGVGEYVAAARRVRRQADARFALLGFTGVDNPSAVPRVELESWISEGVIEYLGASDDVRPHLAQAHCVVLPSYYREGVPRSLLEAAAMARPIITTDAPGCRDTMQDGVSGLLCRARDIDDLEEKMLRMLRLSAEERRAMGMQGRAKVEREFDERRVIETYRTAIAQIDCR
jgi:glycosyltransferase involved in cell wall biosynthesis